MIKIILLVLVFILPFYGFFKKNTIIQELKKYLNLIIKDKHSWKSYSIFILIITFINLVFYTLLIPNILSGYVYGVYKGSLLTIISLILSTFISFIFSKKIKINHSILKNIENKLRNTKSVFKVTELITLSRLSPMFPYHVLTIFYALLDVNLMIFMISSVIGTIPSLLFEVFLGTKMKDIDSIFKEKKNIMYIGVYSVITIIISYLIWKKIKKL
jgi:uncharacterized membrane protein YdjX (TVP38/TMEM64 family)